MEKKIQGHATLRKEMTAVASGEKPAPKNAGSVSFEPPAVRL